MKIETVAERAMMKITTLLIEIRPFSPKFWSRAPANPLQLAYPLMRELSKGLNFLSIYLMLYG